MAGPIKPHPLNIFSQPLPKKTPVKMVANILTKYTGPSAKFGAFAGLMFLYFTDWKLFMDKVPFYRGKFDDPPML